MITTVLPPFAVAAALETWLAAARPNDRCIYHTGGMLAWLHSPPEIQRASWRFARTGRVFLFQRRVADANWIYYAVASASVPHCMRPEGRYVERTTVSAAVPPTDIPAMDPTPQAGSIGLCGTGLADT